MSNIPSLLEVKVESKCNMVTVIASYDAINGLYETMKKLGLTDHTTRASLVAINRIWLFNMADKMRRFKPQDKD